LASTPLLLRRLSTGHDRARHRAAMDNRLVDQSTPRSDGSACRDRPTELVPLRPLAKEPINVPRPHTASAEIPIASDAPPRHASRGFLPWRFAYAGPGARRPTVMGPASENLHRRRRQSADAASRYCRQERTCPEVLCREYVLGRARLRSGYNRCARDSDAEGGLAEDPITRPIDRGQRPWNKTHRSEETSRAEAFGPFELQSDQSPLHS
jgi:hypothetical protein